VNPERGRSLVAAIEDLDSVAMTLEEGSEPARRIKADPENVERGLAQLVLTIVELLRQLMERQAIRRVDAGTLDDDQIERLGETFMKLEQRMAELRDEFGLSADDLNIDLGPLGNLL